MPQQRSIVQMVRGGENLFGSAKTAADIKPQMAEAFPPETMLYAEVAAIGSIYMHLKQQLNHHEADIRSSSPLLTHNFRTPILLAECLYHGDELTRAEGLVQEALAARTTRAAASQAPQLLTMNSAPTPGGTARLNPADRVAQKVVQRFRE